MMVPQNIKERYLDDLSDAIWLNYTTMNGTDEELHCIRSRYRPRSINFLRRMDEEDAARYVSSIPMVEIIRIMERLRSGTWTMVDSHVDDGMCSTTTTIFVKKDRNNKDHIRNIVRL